MQIVNLVPEGFPVYNAETIGYVKDNKLYVNVPVLHFIVTDETDLEGLDNVPIGSVAFTADESSKWRLGIDGTWEKIVSNEE